MPTSSQSQILSVVDYQLLQQQQSSGQNVPTKSSVRIPVNQTSVRRTLIENKNDVDNHFPPPSYVTNRRRSSDKTNESAQSTRTSQRTDVLRMPVINLHPMAQNEARTKSNTLNINDNRQTRSKSTLGDSAVQSSQYHRNSLNSDDEEIENIHKLKQRKKYPTPRSTEENTSSTSEVDNINDDENDENLKGEPQSSLLNKNARRLLVLGTIRPSKTFYKNLPEADVDHLMEYFRRMKQTPQRMTSEEINQELAAKFIEYKPKICKFTPFDKNLCIFDSACVTKGQVTNIEKLIEQYADKIRSHTAEFGKIENPMRFVIKPIDNDAPLTTIPREYNDCFITLVTRSDPLRKSDLVTDLVHEKFLEDVKANSLDISYFPGGVNYDVPREEINENGQMNIETYQKLKKRLNNRKVWHFDGPPEKKPNALLAILPSDSSIHIDHERLFDNLYDRLKTFSTNENSNINQQILSIEFVPLSCILNSNDIPNQFIIDCDTIETKRQLMEKPLKIVVNKQSTMIELHSYDENIQREYEKFVKSEKYRELLKIHDAAIKRTSTK